ncbi:putative mediator of RNA polymerase II transcription subunit [Neohortaea acidophila]|uniref:Mediator of RNA polymerase II transcription subunit 10 n=1 Tax=Neohortaea acidophila TaxID=245834 RepID=A0A6A6Q367_9PEZI|nr:putative mediator of RNA polymerase II transcription subunit [Neohortaea acidophila]KAF2486449.1 putative mediator of RNA polymerase II transcription subunit [Neohortaea acidophila]
MAAATIEDADAHLRAIITNLYMLLAQAHDYHGPNTQQAMAAEIKSLLQNLILVTNTARRLPTYLPIEIIQYVEASRNPDIYTREFVELVMRYNQQQKGRSEAFATFRDILGREMASGIPDIKEDVKRVVEATGGKVES